LEVLEPRELLAVTGVVNDAYATPTKLVVVMKYHGDSAINASTLGNDDLRLTGPNQYDHTGRLVQTVVQADGDVLGVYNFGSDSASGMWDFRRDNGQYFMTLVAGAVRDNAGHANDQAAVRTFGLYFYTPVIELSQVSIPHVGTGVATLQPSGYPFYITGSDDQDSLLFEVSYITPDARLWGASYESVRVTGPNGFVGTLLPAQIPPREFINSTYLTNSGNLYEFAAPGGGWDAGDNGVYTLSVSLPAMYGVWTPEVVVTRQFTVNVALPRATVVSTARTGSAVAVAVRYDAPSGIQLSSLGDGDVTLVARSNIRWEVPTLQQMPATLVGTPVRAANGSVTATYRIQLASPSALNSYNYLVWETRGGAVRDNAGHLIGATRLAALDPSVRPAPDVRSTTAVSATRSALDVDVIFNNQGGYIRTNSISPSNLAVLAPPGQVTRVSVLSIASLSDGAIRVRYRISPPLSAITFHPLASGSYTLVLNSNAISQGTIGYLPATLLGTFTVA
jgi:hypothetical protein